MTSTSLHAQSEPPDPTAFVGAPYVNAQPAFDRSDYSLFNPVPDQNLRPLSTDRPGKTHSSNTLDPGHFQVESDFVTYSYDHNSPSKQTTNAFSLGTPIIKAGLTSWMDLEAGLALFNSDRITDRSTNATRRGYGFGDTFLGTKINFFGNDGGRQALAILPFVKIPTAATNVGNGVTEYTLNVPYTVELDNLWSLTLEPAVGVLKDNDTNNRHGDYSMLANINRPVFIKTITAALEVAGDYEDHAQATPRYTLDPSLQWLMTPSLQLDLGIYLGLDKAAPDYNPYTGISFRY